MCTADAKLHPPGYRLCGHGDELDRAANRSKSTVRSKVQFVLVVMTPNFWFRKMRCRGLAMNAHRLFSTCALVNPSPVRLKLLYLAPQHPQTSPRLPESASRKGQIAAGVKVPI